MIFFAELNGLEVHCTDVGNAYLEAKTKEKLYIIASKGFGELEGHTLVISRALYGLKSSGLCWHEKFADTLHDMGFKISKADNDIWMRKKGNVYEYIAVYVNDLCIAAIDAKAITDELTSKYNYKLKGVGPISFHLGCGYIHDKDGTLAASPQKYIEKMMDGFATMFPGEKPDKSKKMPLVKNDHPELDESPLLGEEDKSKYLSMIGALHWVITLGRFNVMSATVTMARFRAKPRTGHLKRANDIYGYLLCTKSGAIHY